MTGAFLEMLPWAHQQPSWEVIAIILAMAGAGLCLISREHVQIRHLLAGLGWIALLAVVTFALRGYLPMTSTPIASLDGDPQSMLASMGFAILGAFVWLLGGVAAIEEERRKWIAPLAFTLVASAIGTITASDLLVLVMWQFALGANVICVVLLMRLPGDSFHLQSLMAVEAVCLVCAGAALAILGIGLPSDAKSMAFVAIGLAMLLVLFAAKLVSIVVALPLAGRSRGSVLAIEVALMGVAIPAILHPFVALAEELRTLLPIWFVILLSVLASALLFGGAVLAIAVRERGWRIALLATSLIGLCVLGACEASKTALLFTLLWLGPIPAFLAASSIAARIDRGGAAIAPRAITPQADAINILLALACLAVIGLPPFAGFWARLILIQAAWGAADYFVIAVTLLSSLVLAFALSRRSFERATLIADPARRNRAPGIALPELLVLGVMSGLTLAGGIYPAPFIIIGSDPHRPNTHEELTVRR